MMFRTINLAKPSHIKLNISIYSFVPFVNQLTPMSFILLGDSIRTHTMLEYKDSNYPFIALCQV